jgi:glycerol-3-phosphate dehydrogenase (NAD(P)+)
MSRLGKALGGRAETFAGLAGMGDMIATCTSPQSRNRHVGMELAKGRRIEDIIDSMHMVAEGVKSAPTVIELARENHISLPISEDVYRVITGGIQRPRRVPRVIARRCGSGIGARLGSDFSVNQHC